MRSGLPSTPSFYFGVRLQWRQQTCLYNPTHAITCVIDQNTLVLHRAAMATACPREDMELKHCPGAAVIQQVDAITAVIPGGGGWVNLFADTLRRRSCGQAHPHESS